MPQRRAFSLIELMVVIGIIAILIALLLPTMAKVRLHARQVQCATQLRQLGQGLANYVSVFKGSKITKVARYGDAGAKASGRPKGSVMTVAFELDGQGFVALNGGPEFRFTEAVSFSVDCETQAEVDEYWSKLSNGGEEGPCGWLKDRFGLSWQIVPKRLMELLTDADRERAQRAMAAMLKMGKIQIDELEQAAATA